MPDEEDAKKKKKQDDTLLDLPNAIDNVAKAFQKKPKYDTKTGKPLETTPLYDAQTGKLITEESKPIDSLQGLVTALGKGLKSRKVIKDVKAVNKLKQEVVLLQKRKKAKIDMDELERQKRELERELGEST